MAISAVSASTGKINTHHSFQTKPTCKNQKPKKEKKKKEETEKKTRRENKEDENKKEKKKIKTAKIESSSGGEEEKKPYIWFKRQTFPKNHSLQTKLFQQQHMENH